MDLDHCCHLCRRPVFLETLLNVVNHPPAREQSLGGWPRCTRCGRPLAWWQVLPLAGWLAQGGRAPLLRAIAVGAVPVIELSRARCSRSSIAQYGLSVPFWYLSFVAAVLILTARSIGCIARSILHHLGGRWSY